MLRKPADGAPVPISPESCASAAGSAAASRLHSDRKAETAHTQIGLWPLYGLS